MAFGIKYRSHPKILRLAHGAGIRPSGCDYRNRRILLCLLLPILQFTNTPLDPPKTIMELVVWIKRRRIKQAKNLLRNFYNSGTFEYQEIRFPIICALNMER